MATRKKTDTASPVDNWLKRETPHKREALENASRHFDNSDHLTVNTLESIYSQESSFGSKRGKRGTSGPAGDFQLKKMTAANLGLTTSTLNDERFDIDNASAAAGKELKRLHELFTKKATLSKSLKTIPVSDTAERKKFAIAAYNAGEGRIAKAQQIASNSSKDPEKWIDVSEFLEAAGASSTSSHETREYVDKVSPPTRGHWVTVKGQHIFIREN